MNIQGHEGTVCSVAFSPDGRRIVSGVEDKTLKVWGTHSHEEIADRLRHLSVSERPKEELIRINGL